MKGNVINNRLFLRKYYVTDQTLWIPGDWGYIHNKANTTMRAVNLGFEGENIIYLGNNEFWGHLSPKVTILPLNIWLEEVSKWGTDGRGAGDIRGSEVYFYRLYPWIGLKH